MRHFLANRVVFDEFDHKLGLTEKIKDVTMYVALNRDCIAVNNLYCDVPTQGKYDTVVFLW